MLRYIQIFFLVKVAFFVVGIQRPSLIIKKQSKTGILIKLTKDLVIIASSLWTKYWIKKIYVWRSHWHNPHLSCSHTFEFW